MTLTQKQLDRLKEIKRTISRRITQDTATIQVFNMLVRACSEANIPLTDEDIDWLHMICQDIFREAL